MSRVTTANKTIRGFYFEVICAAYEALILNEGDRIACEINNSDFFIQRADGRKVSVEVKNYKNSIGWGDSEFKNSIRNFIDIELNSPNTFKYEFFTNTEMKQYSPNLLLWEQVKSGDESRLDDLIKEINILYINQTQDKHIDDIRSNYVTYEANLTITLDYRTFIRNVSFKFNQDRSKSVLKLKIRELVESILGEDSIVSNDVDSIMYCLIDKVWQSAISNDTSTHKFITKADIITILTDRKTIFSEIIGNALRNEVIETFKFCDEYFEYLKADIDCDELFGSNDDLKEKFLCQLDSITGIMLKQFTTEDIKAFLKSIKFYWFDKLEYTTTNEDLNILVIALAILSLPIPVNVGNIVLNNGNIIKNLGLENNVLGLFYLEPSDISAKSKFLKFLKAKFIDSLPIDIETFDKKDTVIFKNLHGGFFCPNNKQYNISFVNEIVEDIANVNGLVDKSLGNYICNYHCGDCCVLKDDTLLNHQDRIRRLLGYV